MKESIKKEILFLAQTVLTPSEYNKMLLYLDVNRLNDIRLLISEKMDLLSVVEGFEEDSENNTLNTQLMLCDRLENLIVNEFLETIDE